ncbi:MULTISPECIES: 1-phosphofructokinase family hexose kinase [Paenarthrobacter]|uniref:1-phosphofructokinase family hexose kinase n=1 Tax=Paenarthrobacter TaxID=1742992 RepID=UPI00084E3B8A|nr:MULTISPECIES: 1-phosphofructokinase family hexose kinase [Paenarthrobacter]NKR13572.1 phosphofructokinase [Arthrobacter sp. M5]NKR15441.1 phosphofructokinase [Arthrobacter sp. M6]OEH59346.1 phosphofructokinase [Arthrobacter sp. D2]OEH60729.1 phosphofructokinase [Arthrobacter sp. D4]MDO5864366.1 1-phosphofructokinase family hexose kinase [Paenarthrobacter sp. SD-2]
MDASQGRSAQQILTLTVNPALDISTSTERVISVHKLRCSSSRVDPGGGGVNVSRVVQRLGGRSLAVYTAGGPVGEAYRRLIETECIPTLVVPVQGSTRENFTVDETSTGKQFRFVLEGPELREEEWRACLDLITQAAPPGGYVVASGSLPPGVPDDSYARVARLAREGGARCIVDTSGPALAEALAEGVFLIKPSKRELGEYVGASLGSEQSQMDAASAVVASGAAKYVALTLGEAGAVLASESGVIRLPVPAVKVVSTVGAGDSFLAAFVLRLAQGRSAEEAFKAAVAAGSAAPATELCYRGDVEHLEAELSTAMN